MRFIVRFFVVFALPIMTTQIVYSQEICDNALDDDGDGLIDLNDSDCDCDNLIDLSIIPNPSFEEYSCCPDAEAMLTCADEWLQASDATSDYYNFCGLSELLLDGALPPAVPLPGGGEGFIGLYNFSESYREYVGVCLDEPLMAGTAYTMTFHTAYAYGDEDEFDLQIYGNPTCFNLPWDGISCPEDIVGWNLLATENITYSMDGEWQFVTVTFTPVFDVYGFAFGGPCGDIGDTDGAYFYFDELILNEAFTLGEISSAGGWCDDNLELIAATEDEGGFWQWYKDGIALLGENAPVFYPIPYGEGEFTAVYFYDGGCKRAYYRSPVIPTADFDFDNVCLGDEINFVNTSEGYSDSGGLWNLDDGFISNLFELVYEYEDPGTYVVELIVYSEDPSCHDTAVSEVNVFPKPAADFEIESPGAIFIDDAWVICANHPLSFNDLTTIDGPPSFSDWLWEFGDGGTSTLADPIHIFSSEGTYTTEFTITSESGCVDSISKTIIVNRTVAEFDYTGACLEDEMTFTNLSYSTNGDAIISTIWDMDDGTAHDTTFNTNHVFENAGNYDVSLVAINEQGCIDTMWQTVNVFELPELQIYSDKTETDYFNTDFRFTIAYPSEGSEYEWDIPGGDPNSSTSSSFEDVRYPEFEEGEYYVFVAETDENGCTQTDSVIVRVIEDRMVIAPNSFTPNGDNINDNWGVYVTGFNMDEFTLYVFDRWGEIVFQTSDPEVKWDGKGFTGEIVQDGVYAWYIVGRDLIDDRVFEYNGYIVVF